MTLFLKTILYSKGISLISVRKKMKYLSILDSTKFKNNNIFLNSQYIFIISDFFRNYILFIFIIYY